MVKDSGKWECYFISLGSFQDQVWPEYMTVLCKKDLVAALPDGANGLLIIGWLLFIVDK